MPFRIIVLSGSDNDKLDKAAGRIKNIFADKKNVEVTELNSPEALANYRASVKANAKTMLNQGSEAFDETMATLTEFAGDMRTEVPAAARDIVAGIGDGFLTAGAKIKAWVNDTKAESSNSAPEAAPSDSAPHPQDPPARPTDSPADGNGTGS